MKLYAIVFFIISFFIIATAFHQPDTNKFLSNSKWTLKGNLQEVKTGDTVVFKKAGRTGDLFFKSKGTLQTHVWYLRCGNFYFSDLFIKNPPYWEDYGTWQVHSDNLKTTVKIDIQNKAFDFHLLKQTKDSMVFLAENIQTKK